MVSTSMIPILPRTELSTANIEIYFLQISAHIFSEFQRHCTLKHYTLRRRCFFFKPFTVKFLYVIQRCDFSGS